MYEKIKWLQRLEKYIGVCRGKCVYLYKGKIKIQKNIVEPIFIPSLRSESRTVY